MGEVELVGEVKGLPGVIGELLGGVALGGDEIALHREVLVK